jgi:hypothetical protein
MYSHRFKSGGLFAERGINLEKGILYGICRIKGRKKDLSDG